ncbi:MAG TPA: outer membrane beta-barrel protein, partial [bacterium]|nr:outer membrane beta-barrel protein [bacterium]
AEKSQDWIDVNAAYTLSDSLSFAAEYLYWTVINGNAGAASPKINSAALYATYVTPVKNLTVSGRVEQENAPENALDSRVIDSYTFTAKYAMGPVTDILEYRADATNGYGNFTTSNGTPTQIDQTLTVAATYGF